MFQQLSLLSPLYTSHSVEAEMEAEAEVEAEVEAESAEAEAAETGVEEAEEQVDLVESEAGNEEACADDVAQGAGKSVPD